MKENRNMELYVMMLVLITGAVAQQDMASNVFLFPKPTATAHVIFRPEIVKPLQKVTVCLWSYSDISRKHALFSLATPGKDNAFLIFPNPPSSYYVFINQEEILIKIDSEVLDWKHSCVAWDSDTGVIQLWVNGKVYPRRVSSKGVVLSSETSIILAQEQDSFGGGFDKDQSFVGEISDVHMWDYILTPEEIRKVISNEQNGNVINWRALNFDIKGDVLIQPKLQCKPLAYISSFYTQCNVDKTNNYN